MSKTSRLIEVIQEAKVSCLKLHFLLNEDYDNYLNDPDVRKALSEFNEVVGGSDAKETT